ncbi:MAG: hypothetical protein IJ193_02010 [Bacilli bacterium]|nr:hypothetical protein [Bacilli bacterium]
MVGISIIGCIIFTIVIVTLTLKNPLLMVHGYPTKIREKVEEMGLIEKEDSSIPKKIFAVLFFGFLFGVLMYVRFQCTEFQEAFFNTYIIWNVINWYDALIIDCLWFCHSEGVKIKGTEDMKEYSDMKFHLIGGLKGMILGIPVSVVSGLVIVLIQYLFF